jgi:hypothetical protein
MECCNLKKSLKFHDICVRDAKFIGLAVPVIAYVWLLPGSNLSRFQVFHGFPQPLEVNAGIISLTRLKPQFFQILTYPPFTVSSYLI